MLNHDPKMRAKPRLGVVLTEFGIPSEIWAIRQAEAFEHFEPVYFAQQQRRDGTTLPKGRELHLWGTENIGLRQRILRKLGHHSGALPSVAALNTIKNTLLNADLDAVLCHFAWNGVAVQKAIGNALPIICHFHGRDVTTYLQWRTNRSALTKALPNFAHTVAVGNHQIKILRGLDLNLKTSLIPCGAPISLFSQLPIPSKTPEEPIIFIAVGRISYEKGQLQTLSAFEAFSKKIPNGKLIIVGDGPQMDELRKQVALSPVRSKILLTGALSPAAIAKELSNSHVFLQHSRSVNGWVEGFGVTITEAGASGLPIIATSSGGIPDQVLDGSNGFLIQVDDIPAQTKAMICLAQDETLRRKMGVTARNIAAKFDSRIKTLQLERCVINTVRHNTHTKMPLDL